MPTPITIAYITARKEPQFQWFADSLHRETGGDYTGIRVLMIDFYAQAHKEGDGWQQADATARSWKMAEAIHLNRCPLFTYSPPIWGVWQGPHRLTKENWFAKADYLNAAVCLTETTHLACIDDLSVLMPGWLAAVREAAEYPGITCGAYRKVRALEVKDGAVESFRDFMPGMDSRWKRGSDTRAVPCDPGMMYGCSFVVPIEAALAVNGWPHYSNGMGYEDCVTGVVMAKHGFPFRYDRRMLTYESDEHHFVGKQMRRDDPGRSPHDKSHVLKQMGAELRTLPNDWPCAGGLREVRALVLSDSKRALPLLTEPKIEPFSRRPLAELGEQPPPTPVKFNPPVIHNLPPITMSAEVQAEIVKAHALLQGWCPMDKALLLCAEIEALGALTVVDIGTFGGKSTIPMAIQIRANADAMIKSGGPLPNPGRVIAIDPWDNEAACEGYGGANLAYWHAMDFKKIRLGFELQVRRLKLEQFITIWPCKSDDYPANPSEPFLIDLLHIDGQKDATVIRDVNRFASKVRVGGVCCLNDLDWEGGHVLAAAARLLELGFVENYKIGTGAMYRRTHLT